MMLRRIIRAFTEHPRDIGENYAQHLAFTLRMVIRFTWVSMAMIIHGLLPFLFEHTGSRQIDKIHRMMQTRIPPVPESGHYDI